MPSSSGWGVVCAAVACMALAVEAPAIVVHGDTSSTSNPPAHYDPPPHEPGWANVGQRAGTGIYVGNQYVLTAAHLGAGSFVLNGTTYFAEAGSTIQLTNPDGSDTDLILFRITADPGLPSLSIASSTPLPSETLTLIGTGRDRISELKTYSIPPDSYQGYDVAATTPRAKAWGTNQLDAIGVLEIGGRDVHSFATTFNMIVGEAQATGLDSGGAVFNAAGELAGVMLAVDTYEDQPANTALFGNRTIAADLSVYREQIIAVIPEPSAVALLAPAMFLSLRRRVRR